MLSLLSDYLIICLSHFLTPSSLLAQPALRPAESRPRGNENTHGFGVLWELQIPTPPVRVLDALKKVDLAHLTFFG